MSDNGKEAGKDIAARIEAVPLMTREEMLQTVFGADEARLGAPIKDNIPRAMEWVDLLDGGPYVDEMSVPLLSPNGDEGFGKETYGDPTRAASWMDKLLEGLPTVGGGDAPSDMPPYTTDAQ